MIKVFWRESNLKRKLYTMASVIMLILLLFTACSKKTVKLNTPTGLSTDTVTKMLSWTAVDNAVKYRVQIDSKTPEDSSGNTYSLSRLQEGIYHLKVQAIGDGKKFLDSDWSSPIAYVLGNFSMKISNKHGAYSLDENPSLAAEIKIGTSTVSGQKITWTSNNIDIALIDANTGNLTFKKPGLATVTALATINGNEVSDNYTFNVFKSLESKLYLNGLAFTNSGSGSNADGSFTYSADAPSEGTPTIRTVQSYGTGSDYSNATVGPIGRLVDDFCKAALSDTDKKLFLTVVLEHSIDNGPLIIFLTLLWIITLLPMEDMNMLQAKEL